MDMPPYTIEVARLFDAPSRADGMEERYRAMFRAVSRVLGPAEMAEAVGSAEFEGCDLSELEAEFTRIRAEFERPRERAQEEAIDRVSQMLAKLDLDKLARVSELVSGERTRQGFRRLR